MWWIKFSKWALASWNSDSSTFSPWRSDVRRPWAALNFFKISADSDRRIGKLPKVRRSLRLWSEETWNLNAERQGNSFHSEVGHGKLPLSLLDFFYWQRRCNLYNQDLLHYVPSTSKCHVKTVTMKLEGLKPLFHELKALINVITSEPMYTCIALEQDWGNFITAEAFTSFIT